jgi:ribosome-associated protein
MNEKLIVREIGYKAIRSGGPGGQHANKVSSKVVGSFDILRSRALSDIEKLRVMDRLDHRLTAGGELILSCDASRSQHRNKALVAQRMVTLLKGALKKPSKRIPTKVSKGIKIKRAESKKQHSKKKALRRKPNID